MSARRYLAVTQDPKGYPAPGLERAAEGPLGPSPAMIHQVVLADDYERLEEALRKVTTATHLADARAIARRALDA